MPQVYVVSATFKTCKLNIFALFLKADLSSNVETKSLLIPVIHNDPLINGLF